MTTTIRLTVPGVAVPKLRPRVTYRGGRAHAYTPDKTRAWEEVVRAYALGVRPPEPLRVPVGVRARFILPRPVSARTREVWPKSRPDLDQFIKGLLDGLTGVIWDDDSRVCRLEAVKEYVESGHEPRVEVEIWPL